MKHPLALTLSALLATSIVTGCTNRTLGTSLDDKLLDPQIRASVQQATDDLSSPTSHIVLSSYNGVVLIAGQTPTNELKTQAGNIVTKVPGVRTVHNELEIMPPISFLASTNDALLTSEIKTAMLAESDLPSTHIKVITENGVVYMLGLITKKQAIQATKVVQGVSGVQKIVKLFEYTD